MDIIWSSFVIVVFLLFLFDEIYVQVNDEFHLFMKNDKQNIVYVISRLNYGLWSSKKIMPTQIKPMTQTYKVDIALSKKLDSSDNTVEYYEIIKLNSMIETDEID